MTTSLKVRIQEDVKNAMRAKETQRLGTLRLLTAAIKQQEVDNRIELDDTQIVAIISKMLKQRQESIAQYTQGNRPDLAATEAAEIEILKEYLPAALSPEEISASIDSAIASVSPQSAQDMGKVMAILKAQLTGRADLSDVSKQVKARLSF
ncbi:MAG: GatB/YqeY domain-containing protein [Pseudomonadota bacterium]